MLDLAKLAVTKAASILEAAGKDSLGFVGREVKLKQDQELDQFFRTFFESKTNYKVYSEESLGDFEKIFTETCWIIDPLDGSLNYLRGIPFYGLSISLWEKGMPKLGLVYDHNHRELFSADVGVGAWLNDEVIKVSNTPKNESILATGIPSGAHLEDSIALFSQNARAYKKLRWMGSAALSLAYVACGRVDAYQERGIKIWDVAAGLALVKAAGGDYKLERNSDQSFNVFAHNGKLA